MNDVHAQLLRDPGAVNRADAREIGADIPDDLDPAKLRVKKGATAVERGWILDEGAEDSVARERVVSRLASPGVRFQVLAMHHRGMSAVDIAKKSNLSVAAVNSILGAQEKRVQDKSSATGDRAFQLALTEAAINRLAEKIWPEPGPGGEMRPVDTRDVDALMKVLSRRASLTGADMPAKLAIEGEVTHRPAAELVETVNEYMNLADALLESGYGSGRIPPGSEILDAEILNPRELPPPSPPIEPWKKPNPRDHADLVTQSEDDYEDAEIIELDDVVARALRLPAPIAEPPVRPSWSVNAHDD